MAALSFLFTAARSPGATPPAAVGDLGCQRDVAYGRAAPCSPVDPPGAAGQILSGFALASCSSAPGSAGISSEHQVAKVNKY